MADERTFELRQVEVRLRLQEAPSLYSTESITTPDRAAEVMAEALAGMDREYCCVVNLDNHNRPINFSVVSIGDINQAMVPIQNVFKTAILSNAASIMLFHNHPSSDITASREDNLITQRLIEAGRLMNIPVIDHVIVGAGTAERYSFRENQPELFSRVSEEREAYVGEDGIFYDAGESTREAQEREMQEHIEQEGEIADAEEDAQEEVGSIPPVKPHVNIRFANEQMGEEISLYGRTFVPIRIENPDRARFGEWSHAEFVVPAGDIRANRDGKTSWIRLPADGSKNLRLHVGQEMPEGADESVTERVGNQDLKDVIDAGWKKKREMEQGSKQEKAQGAEHSAEPAEKGAGKSRADRMKEITERLEQGVEEVFTSEKYQTYLATMSKFHRYSFNNTLLIALQNPEATLVAGYGAWQKKFNRQVKKGEKGIQIIAPAPVKSRREREVTDPKTGQAILGADGKPMTEEVDVVIPHFKVTTVFDVSQTYGEPLPELGVSELTAGVDQFSAFMEALDSISPVPIRFADFPGKAKGYFDREKGEIVIREGMSESQTMKTAVHEITHSILHSKEALEELGEKKDQMTKEVEAESTAFVVCSYFCQKGYAGLDTSEYSFPYISGWSSGRDMKELRTSMETIRSTASQIIDGIEENLQQQMLERNADRYEIFQIDADGPGREYQFMGLDFAADHGFAVTQEAYRMVYSGPLEEGMTLDSLYEKFNIDHPEDFTGHSMSVSDVVVIRQDGEDHAYYVDSFGFTELPDFLPQKEQAVEAAQEAVGLPDDRDKEIEHLAVALDEFGRDFDPYGYADAVEGSEAHVESIKHDLRTGDIQDFRTYLQEVMAEDNLDEYKTRAAELLEQLDHVAEPQVSETKETPERDTGKAAEANAETGKAAEVKTEAAMQDPASDPSRFAADEPAPRGEEHGEKKSVLQALRDKQKQVKEAEPKDKDRQKDQNRKRGGQEL